MSFDVIGKIYNVETIAVGNSIREINLLRDTYGDGYWRKLKGIAKVRLSDGDIRTAEIHWYEAHGIGKRKVKIKCLLD
ncbi:TPA: hypothetical protein ENS27_12895 [bacterium]|nr:hypothetical protein [bacterium]